MQENLQNPTGLYITNTHTPVITCKNDHMIIFSELAWFHDCLRSPQFERCDRVLTSERVQIIIAFWNILDNVQLLIPRKSTMTATYTMQGYPQSKKRIAYIKPRNVLTMVVSPSLAFSHHTFRFWSPCIKIFSELPPTKQTSHRMSSRPTVYIGFISKSRVARVFQKSMPMKQYSRSRSTLKTVKKPAIPATANHWLSISNRTLVTPSASANARLVTILVASKFWRGSINTGCTGCTRVLQFTSLVSDFCHVHLTYPRPVPRKSIRELVANSGSSLTRSRLVICLPGYIADGLASDQTSIGQMPHSNPFIIAYASIGSKCTRFMCRIETYLQIQWLCHWGRLRQRW